MRIVAIPYDKGGMTRGKGSAAGPDAILQVLGKEANIVAVEGSSEDVHKRVQEQVKKDTIFLGGDHSITYSTVKALKQHHPELKLVVFDAHADLMKDFETPTHESYLRELIEQEILTPDEVTIVGVRTLDPQETAFIKENNITTLPVETTTASQEGEELYVSIDIDVLDSSIAPGTGYPEPDGLQKEQLLTILAQLKEKNSILAYDLVEVNPDKDINNKTVRIAAEIITFLEA